MTDTTLEEKIASAPAAPGVYLFKNDRSKFIYIGKAKNIRARVKSYLSAAPGLDLRKKEMIGLARDVSFIVTENELEALALEANLIKQNRPKYNVVLRDDKNYPSLRIDPREQWPRLEIVRRIKRDGALYFGPYIPAAGMHETLALIRKFFRVRLCRYDLAKEMRPCVQYQMGRCPAPCAGLVSRGEYMKAVDEVIRFLRGKNRGLLGLLRAEMRDLSDQKRYEEAAAVRDRIRAIERIWDSQKVVSPRLGETDVIGSAKKGDDVAVVVLFFRNGLMTGSREFLLRNTADMAPGELMHAFIQTFYAGPAMPPAGILVPHLPDDAASLERWLAHKRGKKVDIAAPGRGLKKQLIVMAAENAEVYITHHRVKDHEPVLAEIRDRLHLDRLPEAIGAFDVSTIHGSDSIGAFILWEHGHFQKRLYRTVHIRTVEGMDDFAMMRESVERILGNIRESVPDLIVIDGGKGQLEAALKGLGSLALDHPPEVVAVAKDPDRAVREGRRDQLSLEDGRPSSLLLKHIRDEAHRFVISRHRKARTDRLLTSSLEQVKGVGRKRRLALLKHFGSLEEIRNAPVEEIARVSGFNQTLAERVKEFLAPV